MNSISKLNSYSQELKPPPFFTVRKMNKADAGNIVSLIRDSYGDSYFYKQFYDPNEIISANESGYLTSIVAETTDGELIGHMALLRTQDDYQLVEPVIAVVKTGFRNRGVLTELAEYLYIQRKPELFKEVTGIYIPPVTSHTFSQKQVYNSGFKDCGIWLSYLPDAAFQKIHTTHSQRLSLVLTYLYIKQPKRIVIFPPQAHTEMIVKLFKNLGVSAITCRIPQRHLQNYLKIESIVKIKDSPSLGQTIIKIVQPGRNVVSEITTKIQELCEKNISVIHLYLSLNDPATYFLAAEFEKAGFFFAGIMPGSACKDALILQYLNDTDIDHTKILLVTDTAREILSYVIKQRDLKKLILNGENEK